MCFSHNFIYYTFVVLLLNCMVVLAQESNAITGKVIDQNGYEVPYAAVGILQKNIGTTSTEDGTFYFRISKNEFEDNLTISSLGFSNFSIKIKDFLSFELTGEPSWLLSDSPATVPRASPSIVS